MGMKFHHAPFHSRVEEGVKNSFMRSAVSGAQERLYHRKLEATNQLGDWEAWRNHAEEIRQHVLEKLDYYLYTLSENVAKRGGSVFFAKTPDEANAYIAEVIEQQQGKKVVKSKSMVTEEINLNAHLEKRGIEVVETDLGEYILQLDEHDPPSHIVAPALHKNKEQIRDVFQEKLSYTGDASPKNLAQFARKTLRADFLTADVGITGCNFAVAETGSVCLVTNEGNADLVTSIPKTVISVMGMERVVPTFKELEILVGMLTRSAVGQKLTSYITVLTGTKLEQEIDGPENFHLVILDNGRSEILGGEFQSVLQCIRCAACINVCPVYRHIGGHSYGSIYPGPIGAVLSPLLGGYEDFKELPYASTLCGACTEACPVKIPLHELLHKHRAKIVEKEGATPFGEKFLMKLFGIGASSPNVYGFGSKIASTAMKPLVSKNNSISKGPGPLKDWTKYREFPPPSRTRFRDWFEAYAEGERKDEKSDN